ncbi:hypothetical protein L195_g027643 [Trifolium pratense]|uniref:Uncharacterized protein n=1 Tax=Trifolium pratense TaxID=57577 RepID=A0A2K3KZT0_TRIPR|nr:hypothetical protein L195_g027643 [Trifolium pratense]
MRDAGTLSLYSKAHLAKVSSMVHDEGLCWAAFASCALSCSVVYFLENFVTPPFSHKICANGHCLARSLHCVTSS